MYIVPDDVFIARFWARMDRSGGCWLWLGPTVNSGYGHITRNYRKILAHRYAYELTFGPIPGGQLVCHRCDVKLCCNPAHLFVGTQLDNMRDMREKGRSLRESPTRARGTRHGRAKITEDAVRTIRSGVRKGVPRQQLADRFGVSLSTVDQVIHGKIWKHVT